MAVNISYVDSYKYYGRCVKLENDSIELLITVDVGPRIIYFAAKGGENLFFNAPEGELITDHTLYKQVFGEDATFHFYGGHRMWRAPQLLVYTEAPDNNPLQVEEIENGVTLTCPEDKVLGFVAAMTVVMDPDQPKITVTSSFTNTKEEPQKNAVWQITQCAPGGVAFVPFAKPFRPRKPMKEMMANLRLENVTFKPLVPGGSLLMFSGGITDSRLKIDDRYLTLAFDASSGQPIKIGTQNLEGWGMYANKGYMLRFDFEHDVEGTYTDGGCSYEAYTDTYFFEMESLGQYLEYKKGETISHTETITLQPLKAEIPDLSDREAVKEFIEMHQ